MKPVVFYIASSGHSGSTLLDMLLGGHPQASSVGEFHRLTLYARENELCTCGVPIPDCDFWRGNATLKSGRGNDADIRQTLCAGEVMLRKDAIGLGRDLAQKALLLSRLRPPWPLVRSIVGQAHARAIEESFDWFDAVALAQNSRVIIDSTKDIRRMKLYYLHAPDRVRIVHLVRDGRAVAASAMRRTGIGMRAAARDWRRKNEKIAITVRGVAAGAIRQVRYEDLCADPKGTINKIGGFLGLETDSVALRLNKEDRHNIAGNPMRFDRSVADIYLDERWKKELNAMQLSDFEAVAGKLNKHYGFLQ